MTGVDYTAGAAGLTDTRDPDARLDSDPDAIRAEIQETRERISNDLDEIGERLNPQNVKEDIKDGIREATIGRVEEMAREVGDKLNGASFGLAGAIRENPLPAAMAGIGLAWLFMSRKDASRTYTTRGAANYETGSYSSSQSKFGEVTESVKESVTGVAGQAQHAVSRAADTTRLQNIYHENPLAAGAGVLALGLAVGLTAPSTAPEQRLLGDVGEQLSEKASEVVRETSEKAHPVAQRAIEQTRNIAREELSS